MVERVSNVAENKEKQLVEVPLEAPPITAGTLTRLVLLIIALINTAAAALGFDIEIRADGDLIYEGISILLDAVVFGYTFWKNNNITKKARIASKAYEQVKHQVK